MKEKPKKGMALDVTPCVQILRQETALLERLSAAQEVVRNAVFAREWTDLEALLDRLNGYSEEFQRLEQERDRIFEEMNRFLGIEKGGLGFYSLTTQLPLPERRELTDLYRRLKLDALRVRLANDTLMTYITEARSTVAGFLDLAFPDRRGRLYSRRGTQVHSEMRSIVLDRCL